MAKQSIKFGLIGPMYPPLDKALEAIPRIESLGWDFVDYPDQIGGTHPMGMLPIPVPKSDPSLPTGFFSDIFMGSMEMSAAAAALSKNLGIVIGVIDPLRRSPAVMAQEMATLAHMSKGRMTFAIGSGEAKQFEPYGEKRDKPATRMEEAIRIWHALWNSDAKLVTRASEFWPLKDAYFPIPLYEDKAPSLLMVGAGEKVFQLAGTICDGWLTWLPGGVANDVQLLAQFIKRMKQIASDNGRDPEKLRFNGMIDLILAETDEIAWRQVCSPMAGWLAIVSSSIDSAATAAKYGFKHPFGENFNWSKDMRNTLVAKEGVAALTKDVPDALHDATHVWGGPERVADRLQTYIDAGINEFCFMNVGAAVDPEYSVTFNRLISDVMVRLGGKPLNIPK